ncbi:PP2C family protein-serine/threonine phosphatase [Simiduia aestuariiviva]|uniref:Protein phosphatase n=1 Tax=Simiduia aestuariiviva TaxID=1510459 RepID=A0A839UKA2_9GAMM|nr:protein phosphatase 2C domain-containing protein [Simiduia aestuariiviva]MBB3168534.1 protein phosphatase [Simiduia aestuariiviva]
MPPLNYSAATDKGLSRDNNEDTYYAGPDVGVWVVADGMGGHEAGEVASAIVRDSIKQQIQSQSSLSQAIENSHKAILEAVKHGVGAPGMGSTVVALRSRQTEYEVAWVGDSRAYLWTFKPDGGSLEQLTLDHSYVQMLVDTGAISASDKNQHPDRNVITQCLGSQELKNVRVDQVHGVWEKDQWIILCSDGLTDELSDEIIARILCESRSPKDAVAKLLQAALDSGGSDNITIQVVESPLTKRHFYMAITDWLPELTGNSSLDFSLYSLALASFGLLCYWLLG